jgi:AhpD family alkylhydroperoxidase
MNAREGRLVRTPLRDLALVQIRHVRRIRYGSAKGPVARIYREVEHDFGVLAPPIVLHAAAPDAMAASWMMLRESMLVPGRVDRASKEAVAAGVSVSNTCPFCVTMHTSTLDALNPGADGRAIAEDRAEAAADESIRALGTWARTGALRPAGFDGPRPFAPEAGPELIGVAVALNYLNRMVNVFLGDKPLPPGAPAVMLGPVTRVLVGLIRGGARRVGDPGTSLELLPDAPPAPDLDWARGAPAISGAFARASAALDAAAEAVVPAAVRDLVLSELAGWDGRPLPLDSGWITRALDTLPPDQRGVGRLALLVALASYRVDNEVVAGFRRELDDDRALLETAAWAALTASREAGVRLALAAEREPNATYPTD